LPYYNLDKRSFSYGFGICALMVFIFLSVPIVESAIPPTRAFPNINVSIPWYSPDTILVESQSSSDQWFLVSDGSMTFNVTENYP